MPTNPSWHRLGRGCLLASVVGLAFWLRIVQVGESLWLDELHTSWVVADGGQQLVPRAAVGNQSPVYFALVWSVAKLAGASEFWLRLPSVLAGTALAAGAYFAVVRWTACWSAGIVAALLVAVDRNCVFYGQEARAYALVQWVGLVHVVLFVAVLWPAGASEGNGKARLFRKSRASEGRVLSVRLAWIATGALLFYLHYTAVLLLAAEMAYCAIVGVLPRLSRAGDRDQPVGYRWRQLTLDLTLLGLCLLPAVPHLREIAQRRQNWFSFVSVRSWWRIWEIGDVFPLHLYVLTPLAILAFSLAGERIRRQPAACGSCRDVRWFLLASCWLLVPLAVAWVATAQGYAPLFFRRYLIVAAVAPILWAALCCAACAPGFWRGACAVVVVVAAVYQGGMIRQWRHDGRVVGDRNQDWHSAVAYINQQAAAGAPVFVRSGLIEAERWYAAQDPLRREFCLLPVLGLYRLERPLDQLFPLPVRPAAYLSAEARHLVLSSGEAWLLVQGSEASLARFETSLRSVWRQAGVPTAAVERRGFGNVAVLHVRLTLSPSLSRHARREAGPP